MTDIELMEQALEIEMLAKRFSEGWHEGIKIDALDIELLLDVATVMRERLEQPIECMCGICKLGQRQWQGLTDDEIKAPIQKAMQHFGYDPTQYSLGGMATIGFYGLVKEIEAKLREKNA